VSVRAGSPLPLVESRTHDEIGRRWGRPVEAHPPPTGRSARVLRRRGEGAVLAVLVALAASGCGQVLPSPTASPPTPGGHAVTPSPSTTSEDALARQVPPPGDVAIAPPPADFGGAAPAPPAAKCPDPPAAGNATGTGTWAAIIGINRYPGQFDLLSAVADARDADEALARYGVPSEQRLVLTDEAATGCGVLAAADWLVAHAGPGSTAVFFYAGHARKLGPGTEAVVAADAMVVADAELARHLAGLQASRTWIAMSSCFGGGFDELLAPGRILTAAAGPHSLAYENEGFRRSYLVQYMVRKAMIEGAAPDSIQQSYEWAYHALAAEYPNRLPFQIDRAGGPLDVHQPGAPRPARPAPVSRGPAPPAPPPAPRPTAPPTTAPPPTTKDNCRGLTLGVVKCN
jgi:hypothetical protein